MKWADVSDSDLRGALNVVQHVQHAPDAARNLIEYFHERFSNEMPYNQEVLLAFVKMAFQRIVDDGWSADQAFGLERRRGHHPRPDTTERDVMAAVLVILHLRKNWKWLEALEAVTGLLFEDENRGTSIVRDAYAKYRDVLESLPDEALASMAPAGTTIISR
ncbi:hypothetical protein IAI53_01355 [Thauera sp. CAU 1555]|uniref:Uncharacterized protein n=1 Tax=Thauera sedimentorum TaxID=2767595 RepID=A0ABR9B585_9RHOO|nr:hypothetical protein [Thauera sedimentorum]MBC9070604.1 hypothetical protein [Thauera sedimentorum]MBD8501523.1 hypothetical protein [Thauera sedimentorum]